MNSTATPREHLTKSIEHHLQAIYATAAAPELAADIMRAMRLDTYIAQPLAQHNPWTQRDAYVITYGDSINREGEAPLRVLRNFARQHLTGFISAVHILPFFPWSSDDGFAVIDYLQVNESLGSWDDISAIADDFSLMSDLVINHCSSRSRWFENYKKRVDPGQDYFIEGDPAADLSAVVRPRTSPLLRTVETLAGSRHVWCTFSHDQIDLNFENPKVLLEFIHIIRFHLDRGVKIFRLDAVAFLWKVAGTPCINLPQTHAIIKLLRTLIEHVDPEAIIITETNIPNRENLSYFGDADEAHLVYNFSLPPLLLYTLVSGNCSALRTWLRGMPPARNGTAYLNFIASHDGIGLRPAEGLLAETDIDRLAALMQQFGGKVSYRSAAPDVLRPYELNIALFDALQGTLSNGRDELQLNRFICAHTVMLSLEGIPAFYIHSLFATTNDYQRMEHSGHNRAINRHQWQLEALDAVLEDIDSHHRKVFAAIKHLLALRRHQKAFHPNATQFTLQLGDQVLGIWRQSQDREQSIFCLHNISSAPVVLRLAEMNLIAMDTWFDLLAQTQYTDLEGELCLPAYGSAWLSNRLYAATLDT